MNNLMLDVWMKIRTRASTIIIDNISKYSDNLTWDRLKNVTEFNTWDNCGFQIDEMLRNNKIMQFNDIQMRNAWKLL